MLKNVHEHMIAEVEVGNRTDTILVVVALLFNITTLCINSMASTIASTGELDRSATVGVDIVLAILILMVLTINGIALAGLLVGRRARRKLLDGLVAMYADNEVDKYYDRSLLEAYSTRYLIFSGVIIVLGVASILVPLILRFLL